MMIRRSASGRRAFTLVEVMMAAAIIGLGVLGLIALFAGAARQQQVASHQSSAVRIGRNAEGVLASSLGRLRARTPEAANNAFPEDQWVRLAMDRRSFDLTINPRNSLDGLFFEANSTETLPYALYSRTYTNNATRVPAFRYEASSPVFPFQSIRDFNHRRIIPETLRLEVTTADVPAPGAPSGEAFLNPITFIYRMAVDPMNDPGSLLPGIVALYRNGDGQMHGPGPMPDFIRVNLREVADPSSSDPAFIDEFRIYDVEASTSSPPARLIETIRLTSGYFWKNDTLISINDRIIYKPEPRNPDGRVAEFAYSVLYRRKPGDVGQMALFVYSLTPDSPAARWLPPERESDLNPATSAAPPIRLVEGAMLYLDRDLEQYYVRVPEADRWSISVGQNLMFQFRDGVDRRGAEFPVKVVRRVRDPDAEDMFRGYLDRGPRTEFGALAPTTGPAPVDFFAINEIVESLADGSRWRLQPVEVRTFQIGAD